MFRKILNHMCIIPFLGGMRYVPPGSGMEFSKGVMFQADSHIAGFLLQKAPFAASPFGSCKIKMSLKNQL